MSTSPTHEPACLDAHEPDAIDLVIARLEAIAPSRLLLLGGPTLGPRRMYWNFVASSQDRIDRAAEAWRARAFPLIPTDDQEFVPLPEDHR